MPSMIRGLLIAGLIAISMHVTSAAAQAGSVSLVRPSTWTKQHAYALEAAEVADHPEWQLKDGSTPLYVGARAAADFGNADFRTWWIAKAQRALAASSARTLLIDDVFMERRANALGSTATRIPTDPRTGAAMTEANWQKYMADFVVAVRAALPGVEIVHDVLWYKGDAGNVLRGLQAADAASVDGGFNGTLTYGTSTYGFQTLAGWIERQQARGAGVILDGVSSAPAPRIYNLASYLLTADGRSSIANEVDSPPDLYWPGYGTIDLGAPLGPRYQVATGTWRRNFRRGVVLVNEPSRGWRQFTLPAGYQDFTGTPRTTVSLTSGQAEVLVATPPAPVATPTPTPPPSAPTQVTTPVSPTPSTSTPPVAPDSTPTKITTITTGGDGARIARAGGTAGAKAPGSTRVSVRGSRTLVSGRVRGAVAGYVRVTIERKRGAKWAVVRRIKVSVKRTGRFTKDIPTLPGGSYRVSGYFEGTGTSKPARSGYSTF